MKIIFKKISILKTSLLFKFTMFYKKGEPLREK